MMKIMISSEHIETGKCQLPQKCMIAAAIRDADRSISYVAVRTNGITITKRSAEGSVREHWSVPIKAARAIIDFDAGREVTPFSFVAKFIDRVDIPRVSTEKANKDAKRTRETRVKRKAAGIPTPTYGRRSRVAGV